MIALRRTPEPWAGATADDPADGSASAAPGQPGSRASGGRRPASQPEGSQLVGGTFELDDQQLVAGPPAHPGQPTWALTVCARGRCDLTGLQVLQQLAHGHHPALKCATGISGTGQRNGPFGPVTGRAPSVNGHPRSRLRLSCLGVRARQLGLLYGNHVHPGARVMIKIADGVRYGVGTKPSVRFPAQLTGLAPGPRVGAVSFRVDNGVMRASQYFLTRQIRPNYSLVPTFSTDPATAHSGCTKCPEQLVPPPDHQRL